MKKQISFIIITTLICSVALGVTEIGKLAHQVYLGKFKADRYDKIQKIISACEHDKHLGNKLSEKESTVCRQIMNNEEYAKSSYNNYMKACAFKKLENSSKQNKAYYDQQFVDFLSKRGKLSLLESKNSEDKAQLESLVQQSIAEIQEKELPAFEITCKKSLTYIDFYNNYLITGKTLPTFS